MFVLKIPYFNLNQIYDSKQAPRWIKLKDNKYIIPYKDKALKVEQQDEKIMMSCSENEFFNIWFNYFDLSCDYFKLNSEIKRLGRKFKITAVRGKGIHLLNQDDFEMYVYCKLIKNIGFDEAQKVMNYIAETCGVKHIQSMKEAGKITWYEWPTPEMIIDNINKLKDMGKVNNWLRRLCKEIEVNFYAYSHSTDDLYRLLGRHDMTVFPIDKIEDIIERNFDCIPNEFSTWYLYDINHKGLVYLYILYHVLNKPKSLKEVTINGFSRFY